MIHFLLDIWRSLTDPERLIRLLSQVITGWAGYALLAAIVFAETGLLVGLFLPGDSLLFTVGVVAGAGELDIVRICTLLTVMSILGDQSGYFLGLRTGPRIFRRKDSLLFKQEYVTRTQEFYEKYGGQNADLRQVRTHRQDLRAVHGGRGPDALRALLFVQHFRRNRLGSVDDAGRAIISATCPLVRRNFEKVVIGIVLVSVLPMVVQIWKSRRTPTEPRL